MTSILIGVCCIGAGLLIWFRWRRDERASRWALEHKLSEAARAAVLHGVADPFIGSLGGLAGGLLVLPEVFPFGDYARLRAHTYEEILARTDSERSMAEHFDRVCERWSDAQRAAVGRLEEDWPRLEALLRRAGVEADLTEFARIVLVAKLCRLLKDPIAKNHALITDGFVRHTTPDRSRSNRQLIKDFLRYMDETDMLPHDREIAARLCVLRATQSLRSGAGNIEELCEAWREEWRERFPKGYISDPGRHVRELYIWILADIFRRMRWPVPPMYVDQGIFFDAVEEYQVDRYQENLRAGSASTISDMGGAPSRARSDPRR